MNVTNRTITSRTNTRLVKSINDVTAAVTQLVAVAKRHFGSCYSCCFPCCTIVEP